jgi:hypothetical protein
VTLECGQPGEPAGVEKAVGFITACLRLPTLPPPPPAQKLDLFHALAQVKLRETLSFSFSDPKADVLLRAQLDSLNFTELPPGTALGQMREANPETPLPLTAHTDEGVDIACEFFRIDAQGRLVLRKTTMPSMLSLDERVIRQDCLGYLMERLAADAIGMGS